MQGVLEAGDRLVGFLRTASSLEYQLALSAVVVAGSAVAARYLAPWAIRKLGAAYDDRFRWSRVDRTLRRADDYLPFTPDDRFLVAGLQGLVVLVEVQLLLVIWGLTGVAVDLLWLLYASLPGILQVAISVVFLLATYAGLGIAREFVERLGEESDRIDQHQGEIIYRVTQVGAVVVAGLVVLGIWRVDLGGLLVGAGFLGIVVGMAARQTLGALLAGFVLMFSRPFEVGDWIEVDGREGVVTDITIVNTRLENFDGEYVVIPNDQVSNSTVVNRTKKGRLRVRLEVGVDYGVDPERAESVAIDAVRDLEEVMAVPRPQVVPTRFGDSAILLELRFWIDNPSARRRWRARAAVLRSVYDRFRAEDVKIPYPQRELSGRAEAGGFQVAGGPERAGDRGVEPPGPTGE